MPRPLGPMSTFHCSEEYGPELPRLRHRRITDSTFQRFREEFDYVFNLTAALPRSGNNEFVCVTDCDQGNYTEHWGAAFVSVDGQKHTRGFNGYFSVMSQSKVIAYALAIKKLGINVVKQFVSSEPSGRPFGTLDTLQDSRAFNPYVSTGAEMVWALLDGSNAGGYRASVEANRDVWERMSQESEHDPPRVRLMTGTTDQPAKEAIANLPENVDYLLQGTPNINLAVIYVMAARLAYIGGKQLPGHWSPAGTYQGFVEVNNLRVTVEMMATVAATLANGGVNPFTGKDVLPPRVVQYVLSTMTMAGMYDQSGRWMFEVGMPAKSGVAGGLLVVAPGVGGFATISEPLNSIGNSARGISFFGGLAHRFPMLHGMAPGYGLDPNDALKPDGTCDLAPRTIQIDPSE